MLRAIVVVCCWFACGGLLAQPAPGALQISASGPQTFSVATIKPSAVGSPTQTQIRGNRFVTLGTTFVDLFKYAYNVHPDQVTGGADWMRTQRFDVVADPETEKRPTSDEFKAMMRELLVERFHVTMHTEQKMLPVYALVKASGDSVGLPVGLKKSAGNAGGIPVVGYDPRGELEVGNATMGDVAKFLQRFVLDRPAVDETGIEGRYDVVLRWTPLNAAVNEGEGSTAPPDLFTAIKEELGLKLKPTKAMTDVFVIEHIELPSAS